MRRARDDAFFRIPIPPRTGGAANAHPDPPRANPGLGMFDNEALKTAAFASNPILSQGYVRNSGLIPDGTTGLDQFKYIIPYIHGVATGHNVMDDTLISVAIMQQTMAPGYPDTFYLDAAGCGQKMVIAFVALANNVGGLLNRVAPTAAANFAVAIGAGGELHGTMPAGLTGLPPAAPLTVDGAGVTADSARIFLVWIANRIFAGWKEEVVGLYTALYIAIPKRGEISGPKLSTIARELRSTTGMQIPTQRDLYRDLYRYCGAHVNHLNAAALFTAWADNLPQSALRVQLTLQQAAGSGLTQILIIGRAVREHPGFPWVKLAQLFQAEFAAASGALAAIANNAYYGFSTDLGAARSTRYPNLAWVCKEILIRYSGEGSLREYQGWVQTPKARDLVEDFFTFYTGVFNNQFEADPTPDMAQAASVLIDEVRRSTNIF